MAGATELGLPANPDYNGATREGVGVYQRAIHKGRRQSSAVAFLRPARKRKNLEIRTRSQESSIVFDGRRAVGVRYIQGGPQGVARAIAARREIVVCAGAVNTPRLLQISGVGALPTLRSLGVSVVHELPGVGENLRDHYCIRMVAKAKNTKTINNMVTGLPLLGQIARWAAGKPSLLAVSPSLISAFWRSSADVEQSDLQFTFTPASFREEVVGLLDNYPGMTVGLWQCRPESLGHVRAVSTDPFSKPLVQPNYLAHETDRRVMISGIRMARALLHTRALSHYLGEETAPGAQVVSDDELLSFARETGTTVYHLMGTSRMGPRSDPLAVVDARLRPYGLDGLRIADASIMPSMPSANTNATTMMIAEKAADMIIKDRN
jgi:choline dehydrogenase